MHSIFLLIAFAVIVVYAVPLHSNRHTIDRDIDSLEKQNLFIILNVQEESRGNLWRNSFTMYQYNNSLNWIYSQQNKALYIKFKYM